MKNIIHFLSFIGIEITQFKSFWVNDNEICILHIAIINTMAADDLVTKGDRASTVKQLNGSPGKFLFQLQKNKNNRMPLLSQIYVITDKR